ncbi:hypothetical protein D3C76_1674340 [compost metagenome]
MERDQATMRVLRSMTGLKVVSVNSCSGTEYIPMQEDIVSLQSSLIGRDITRSLDHFGTELDQAMDFL